jgi:hypothetical protein
MNTPLTTQPDNPWEFPVISHELITQQWCSLHRLIEDLSAVQARLGTPMEQSGDYDVVRELGHKIRNKLHLMQLWAEMGMISRDELLLEMTAS